MRTVWLNIVLEWYIRRCCHVFRDLGLMWTASTRGRYVTRHIDRTDLDTMCEDSCSPSQVHREARAASRSTLVSLESVPQQFPPFFCLMPVCSEVVGHLENASCWTLASWMTLLVEMVLLVIVLSPIQRSSHTDTVDVRGVRVCLSLVCCFVCMCACALVFFHFFVACW